MNIKAIQQARNECENLIARKYMKALAGEMTMVAYEAFAKTQRQACEDYINSFTKQASWLDVHAE